MYYESREHVSVPVANAAAAVAHLASPGYCSNQVPVWRNKAGQRIALVPDGHINNPTMEIAVINLDTMRQLESLTFGWMDSEAQKLIYVEQCEDGHAAFRDATISIDGAATDRPAQFECGCCGDHFTSTIAAQKIHDQDAGYGICARCAHHYAA